MEPTRGVSRTYSGNGVADGAPPPSSPSGNGATNDDRSHDTGGHDGSADDLPLRPPGPSTHLALIVLGIAAAVMITGAVAAGLTGGTPARVSTSVFTAKGSPLRAVAARPELSSMINEGLPPSDIVAALAVPFGTKSVPGSVVESGIGSYDDSIGLSVDSSEQKVIAFFRAQLPADRWHLLSQGTASGATGYQIVSQHPGSNGYEWELGITVMPETFAATPSARTSAGAPSSAGGTTPFTLRLFEVTDSQ